MTQPSKADCIESRLVRMTLSPTSSPSRSKERKARYTSPSIRQERQNRTPVRQDQICASATYSYMSPGPPVQPQAFLRTHSSPSVIDSTLTLKDTRREDSTGTPSPTSVSGATFSPRVNGVHRSELTPVISNAARNASLIYTSDNQSNLEEISVPGTGGFKLSSSSTNPNTMILPRKSYDGAEMKPQVSLRPISPPSWPVHRQTSSSTIHKSQSTIVNTKHRSQNSFVGPSGSRMRSAFPSPSEKHEEVPSLQRIIPYQPSRDDSLGEVGMISDDGNANTIFLNHHYRNHSTDDSHETIETASSVSIPSIHHASRLRCETSDSVSGVGRAHAFAEEDEDSYMMEDDGGAEERAINGNGADLITFGQMQGVAFLPEETRSRPSSHPKQESRYMSPEKEREVYQWLHSLEVDKDNNEYVAEAASSKFLTGKMDIDNDYVHGAAIMQPKVVPSSASLDFEPSAELNSVSLDFEPSAELNSLIEQQLQYLSDSESENESDRGSVSTTSTAGSPSRSRPSTGNKEVMGINVNLYRGNKSGKKKTSRMMLRSRATR